MSNKSKNLINSLKNAFIGFISAFRSEKNLRIHLFATIAVICFGLLCKITINEWIAVIIIIALVIISELFNTAVELSVDCFSPEENQEARKIKDISASAVLIATISSVVVGILIFGSKVLVFLGLD